MNTVLLIRKKRNKETLTRAEVNYLISGYTKGKIPDYQFSSLLMAIYLNGLTKEETAFFTEAMINSGIVVDLSSVPGPKIDKHSTGGVGDKTSIMLGPIVAAAGVNVPMISGRGLGHSGGTLDKLESIPGFSTDLTLKEYKSVLKKCGLVMIGQTKEIAPADKLIYALRDVTSTVESIPLITSSIMSKKLAEGIDGIVLDVKTGNGAFMQKEKDAVALAESLMNTAKSFNKKVLTFITDMNQPLGNYVGNWLEIYESVQVLRGNGPADLTRLVLTLSGAMIYLGGKAKSIKKGIEIAGNTILNGSAYNKFIEMTELQGGDSNYIKNLSLYPKSIYKVGMTAKQSGYIHSINTFEVGMAAIELGAGRITKEDTLDHKAGLIFNKKIGDKVTKGEIIVELFADSKNKLALGLEKLSTSFIIKKEKAKVPRLIKRIII